MTNERKLELDKIAYIISSISQLELEKIMDTKQIYDLEELEYVLTEVNLRLSTLGKIALAVRK